MTAPSAAMRAAEEIVRYEDECATMPLPSERVVHIAAIIAKHAPADAARVREALEEARSFLDVPTYRVGYVEAHEGVCARIDAALAASPAALCEGCPPVGYPTDKTRCAECPRRAQNASTAGEAFVLVPRRPTSDMIRAAIGWREQDTREGLTPEEAMYERIYCAMLAAAEAGR